jgi:enoyl-[acyl-carrier-protein] reductase (NADH)
MLFLVSDQASAITGQVMALDGGVGRGIFYEAGGPESMA